MQHRISDFQSVYNISENKFQPTFEKVNVKKCIDEIVAHVKQDLKGRYMDINLVFDKDVPETIISDQMMMKNVILNLFNQSVVDQARGFVKINVSYRETGLGVSEPCIAVTLENSKFVIKPKDSQRLNRMSQEKEFAKIIEAKCEVNYKIAKILTNALNWNIDFNAFKSAKQTIYIPVKAGLNVDLPPEDQEQAPVAIKKDKKPKRNEQDLFNEIEGQRKDVQLPIITEEKPGFTGTNETNEQELLRMPENYPLRQLRPEPEVLLVSYSDLKPVVEQKIGFKCEEAQMENMAMEKIENAIRMHQDKKRQFYKYIMVDLDDVTIIIDRMGRKIKKLLQDAKIKNTVKLLAFSTQVSDNILQNCQRVGFTHYYKPSKHQALDLLRFMAQDEWEDDKDFNNSKTKPSLKPEEKQVSSMGDLKNEMA